MMFFPKRDIPNSYQCRHDLTNVEFTGYEVSHSWLLKGWNFDIKTFTSASWGLEILFEHDRIGI